MPCWTPPGKMASKSIKVSKCPCLGRFNGHFHQLLAPSSAGSKNRLWLNPHLLNPHLRHSKRWIFRWLFSGHLGKMCCPLAKVDEWRRVSKNRTSLLDALFCLDLEPCGNTSTQCRRVNIKKWRYADHALTKSTEKCTEKSTISRNPEGPTIKTIWSRSKFSISIEIFDLARKFQSRRLEFPQKIVPRWVARSKFHSRSKFSISLEISNFFSSLGPLGNSSTKIHSGKFLPWQSHHLIWLAGRAPADYHLAREIVLSLYHPGRNCYKMIPSSI